MDLFVINRYRETTSKEENEIDQEEKHLQELKQKIEERKKAYATNKKSDVINLKTYEQVSDNDISGQDNDIDIDRKSTPHKSTLIKSVAKEKLSEFKVLGAKDFEKKTKVHRVLPYWLSHPYIVATNLQNLMCSVEELDWLHPTLKATLLSEGITQMFPVQEKVIPFILSQHKVSPPFWPHDICVSAPTGSGKTLSFVLPIIQVVMGDIGRHVRALVVLPVQELAAQVAKVFRKYCTNTGLKVALLSGSTPLQQEQRNIVQYTEFGWISEVDIIVCTAGRLVEHLQTTNGFSLRHLKFLVIDEADRIMDHIQNDWLYHMDRHIKLNNELMTGKVPSLSWANLSSQLPPPHKLLFSATLSHDPEQLKQWGLFQPKLFSTDVINDFEDDNNVQKYTTPNELKEEFVMCSAEEKPLILYHFIAEQKWDKVLCFTNAAQTAHRLTVLLNVWGNGSLKVAELSAALDMKSRDLVLKKFTQSEINVLIGTDALARGIDIPDCNYVVSYDSPRNLKTYVHRVGRTGRAGRAGRAITILLQNQTNLFKNLIQSRGESELPKIIIPSDVSDRLSFMYAKAMQKTKQQIKSELGSKIKKSIELKRGYRSKNKKENM